MTICNQTRFFLPLGWSICHLVVPSLARAAGGVVTKEQLCVIRIDKAKEIELGPGSKDDPKDDKRKKAFVKGNHISIVDDKNTELAVAKIMQYAAAKNALIAEVVKGRENCKALITKKVNYLGKWTPERKNNFLFFISSRSALNLIKMQGLDTAEISNLKTFAISSYGVEGYAAYQVQGVQPNRLNTALGLAGYLIYGTEFPKVKVHADTDTGTEDFSLYSTYIELRLSPFVRYAYWEQLLASELRLSYYVSRFKNNITSTKAITASPLRDLNNIGPMLDFRQQFQLAPKSQLELGMGASIGLKATTPKVTAADEFSSLDTNASGTVSKPQVLFAQLGIYQQLFGPIGVNAFIGMQRFTGSIPLDKGSSKATFQRIYLDLGIQGVL